MGNDLTELILPNLRTTKLPAPKLNYNKKKKEAKNKEHIHIQKGQKTRPYGFQYFLQNIDIIIKEDRRNEQQARILTHLQSQLNSFPP